MSRFHRRLERLEAMVAALPEAPPPLSPEERQQRLKRMVEILVEACQREGRDVPCFVDMSDAEVDALAGDELHWCGQTKAQVVIQFWAQVIRDARQLQAADERQHGRRRNKPSIGNTRAGR